MEQNRRNIFRLLISIIVLISVNACTVKTVPVQPGTIPVKNSLAPGEADFGKKLYAHLRKSSKLDRNLNQVEHLKGIFSHLSQAAKTDHIPGHIYLFQDRNVVDVRAVNGNYFFVWSGFLDITENDDEVAAILACEMGHVLARHTNPVEFTVWTDVFFQTAELATTIALFSLSQGTVMIGGSGWMKWAYVEVADLDPLDRVYSIEEEREAAAIGLLILARSQYSPEALLAFWQRVQGDTLSQAKYDRLNRNLPPSERVAIVEELLLEMPQWASADTHKDDVID